MELIWVSFFFFLLIVLTFGVYFRYKPEKTAFIVSVLLLAAFMGGAIGYKDDYMVYKGQYEGTYPRVASEVLYRLTMDAGNKMGLNHDQFSFVIIISSFLLLVAVSYKFVGRSFLFLLLYLIFPMFLNIVQIRNFIAEALLLLAIYILTTDDKNKETKALLLLIVATLYQLASALYIPIVWFYNYNLRNRKLTYIFMVFLFVGSMVLSVFPSALMTVASGFLDGIDFRINKYFTGEVRVGFIFHWAMLITNIYITSTIRRVYCGSILKTTTSRREIWWGNVLLIADHIMKFMLLYAPLFRMQSAFSRIIENMFPLLYIVVIISLKDRVHRGKYMKTYIVALLYFLIVITIKLYLPHMADLVVPMFSYRRY